MATWISTKGAPEVRMVIECGRFLPMWIVDPSIKKEERGELSQCAVMPYYCYACLKMEPTESKKDCAWEILPDKLIGGVS